MVTRIGSEFSHPSSASSAVSPEISAKLRSPDLSPLERKVIERQKEFAEVWNEGDPEAIADFYLDTCTAIVDGQGTLSGRDEIIAAVRGLIKDYKLELMSLEIVPSNSKAFSDSDRFVHLRATWKQKMSDGSTRLVASDSQLIKDRADGKYRLGADELTPILNPVDAMDPLTAQVRYWEQGFADVWNKGDTTAIADHYTQNPRVSVFAADGKKLVLDGKKQVMGAVEEQTQEYELTLKSVHARTVSGHDDVVEWDATWEQKSKKDGKTTELATTGTSVRTDRDPKWRVDSETLIPQNVVVKDPG
jgi:uncharacterized protein (TIGR02246 family)